MPALSLVLDVLLSGAVAAGAVGLSRLGVFVAIQILRFYRNAI